jgi:hypothetical protein
VKAQRQGNIGRSVAKKIFNRSNTGPIGPINGLSTGTEGKITSDDKKGHTIRIIVGIIAVVVVVVVIASIAFITMGEKKSSADSEADGMAVGGAEVGTGLFAKSLTDGKVGS